MITGELKSVEEIAPTIADFKKVLIVGCGGCVSVSLTGGDRESRQLALELAHVRHYPGDPPEFTVQTIERQCETDWLESYFEIPEGVEESADVIVDNDKNAIIWYHQNNFRNNSFKPQN